MQKSHKIAVALATLLAAPLLLAGCGNNNATQSHHNSQQSSSSSHHKADAGNSYQRSLNKLVKETTGPEYALAAMEEVDTMPNNELQELQNGPDEVTMQQQGNAYTLLRGGSKMFTVQIDGNKVTYTDLIHDSKVYHMTKRDLVELKIQNNRKNYQQVAQQLTGNSNPSSQSDQPTSN